MENRQVLLKAVVWMMAAVFHFVFSGPGMAQTDTREPVTMAWADLYPWFYRDPSEELGGLAVELGQTLAAELGFELQPLEVQSYLDWAQAQGSGASILLPAVAPLPALRQTNVFTDLIFSTQVRLAVAAENVPTFDPNDLENVRIGVLGTGAGSDPTLLPGAEIVTYPNLDTALLGLLAGEVTALSAEENFVFSEARRARLDYRIVFVGQPLQTIERAVAIHESRAELLEPANAVLDAMRADGRLDELLRRYNVPAPPPAPDVLTVGVFDLEPYMVFEPGGRATGFAVEALRDIAELSGLEMEFVPIEMAGLAPGETHDILPAISITATRAEVMDFVYPIESSEFSIFMRAGEIDGIQALEDLRDLRVGVFSVSFVKGMAEAAGIAELVDFEDGEDADAILQALQDETIDAFLFENTFIRTAIARRDLEERIVEVLPPFHVSQRAPALRPGLGDIRERMNAVIPGYLVSEDYNTLRLQFFGTPVFWTSTRILTALGVGAGALLFIIFTALMAQLRSARRVLAAESVASQRGTELETIFNAATSGIVAVNSRGTVVRANDAARHMLGGISDPTPFQWPEDIQFVDVETLANLDASADPMQRALSGNKLQKETHLLRRPSNGNSEERRYVRVDSAQLRDESGEDLVVLVIDDVSNEERNRQVVERTGRLDALGQLTGGIAHDFNNLLTSLLYAVVLARRTQDAVERSTNLNEAEAAINRGRSLTARLLSFARKQPGLAEGRSVATIFAEFETLVRPVIETSIDLVSEPDAQRLVVHCDQTQLESALMNLVLNSRDAILHSGNGDTITLKARAVPSLAGDPGASTDHSDEARFVEVSVTDNGPGMDAETLARATDPFFTTKDTNSGTGLGLAMVYGFARQANGALRIYSEEGVGTTVQLTLPRGISSTATQKDFPSEVIEQGAGETILLVEDEFQILSITSKLLRDIGYEVLTAASGREALDLVQSGTEFDLLLTDVVMPGQIGGFDLAGQVASLRPDMPVIYMSGYTGFTTAEMGEVVAPMLQKPAPPAELSRAVAKALKKET